MTMTKDFKCQSCGMAIESSPYCPNCTDQDGQLQAFEVRLGKMVQWLQSREPVLSPLEARRKALAAMAEMPAWRDHPTLKGL